MGVMDGLEVKRWQAFVACKICVQEYLPPLTTAERKIMMRTSMDKQC
jgi:hypothetical protein